MACRVVLLVVVAAALLLAAPVDGYAYFSCSNATPSRTCSGFPRNATYLNGIVYHTWSWPSVRGGPIDNAYSHPYQGRLGNSINASYSAQAPMSAVRPGDNFTILWTRVDPNDGTIDGSQRVWVYCDPLSPTRNAAAGTTSDDDGGLVDMAGPWHRAATDANGTPNPGVNYTQLGYYSYCNSNTGDPDDIEPSHCTCYEQDLGIDHTLFLNTNYAQHCQGVLRIPTEWGQGVFTCVWFYEIYKTGYFNRYPFVFEVNVSDAPAPGVNVTSAPTIFPSATPTSPAATVTPTANAVQAAASMLLMLINLAFAAFAL